MPKGGRGQAVLLRGWEDTVRDSSRTGSRRDHHRLILQIREGKNRCLFFVIAVSIYVRDQAKKEDVRWLQ
jgi:hypothetical protein